MTNVKFRLLVSAVAVIGTFVLLFLRDSQLVGQFGDLFMIILVGAGFFILHLIILYRTKRKNVIEKKNLDIVPARIFKDNRDRDYDFNEISKAYSVLDFSIGKITLDNDKVESIVLSYSILKK